MDQRTKLLLTALVVIAGAAAVIYGPALRAPFIFDDENGIAENASIWRIWPLVGDANTPGPLNPPQEITTSGRPLVNLSLALNYHYSQLSPVGYHLFNLMIHVLSALLLLSIVERTLCLDCFHGRFQRASGPLALATALLWAVHPLQTEAVIYVSQRTELLVGFFYLATLYCSLRYWAAPANDRLTWLTLSIAACLAGMACKEVMVTAPVIVLLFERTFVSGTFRRAIQKSWPLYVGLFLSWGLLLYLNYSAPRSNTAGFHLGVSALAWWLTQMKVLLMYLKLAVWPWPLSIHYEIPYLPTLGAAWQYLLPVALLAVATLVLLWRRSAIGFVGAWVLIILSPTCFVPIVTEVAAERRMYLPLAGLAALLIVGGYAVVQRISGAQPTADEKTAKTNRSPEFVIAAIALALAVILTVVSVSRASAYRHPITLWQNTLAAQPDDPLAHDNLAVALNQAGRWPEAIEQCKQSLQLEPNGFEAHVNYAGALNETGQLQEAIEHLQEALRLRPDFAAKLHSDMAAVLIDASKPKEAIEHCQEALRINPNYAEAHKQFGDALAALGQGAPAIEHYETALRLKPNFYEAQNHLGLVLAKVGQSPEAINKLQRALELHPNSPEAHNDLGNALFNGGLVPQAITHYRQAVLLRPNFAEAECNLGIALIQLGQAREAAKYLQDAVKHRPNFADAYDSLGIALFASNRTEDALQAFKEAIRIRPDNGDSHENMGIALTKAGRSQEAIDELQQALRLEPDASKIKTYANLITIYTQLGRQGDAIAAAETSLELARSTGQKQAIQQIEDWLTKNRAQPTEKR